MKKSTVFLLLFGLVVLGGCNLPITAPETGMSQETAVSGTMTAIVSALNATATAQAGGMVDNEGMDDQNEVIEETPLPTTEPIIMEDIPWCPAVGYITHRPGKQEIAYWPVINMGKEEIIYSGFSESIYRGEAILPLDDDVDPETMSLVYFKAQDDAIYQWKQMQSFELVREDVFKSHMIMAPASDKFAFSVVNNQGSEIFMSTTWTAGFAQPLLKTSRTDLALDPLRMLLDDAGNLLGLYVGFVNADTVNDYWFRSSQGLVYIDVASEEPRDILDESWQVLDVSQTGRLAAVIDPNAGSAVSIYEINQNAIATIPFCDGCTEAGAALIRPDDGLVAWTEKRGEGEVYLLRVADTSGNVTFEIDSTQASALVGVEVDALQAKGWLTSGLLLVDSGLVKNQVFVLNVVTGDVPWKSSGNFLSLVYDPDVCK